MSLPRTVACAEKVVDATIGTYFAPNKTIRELHEMAKSGTGIDPRKELQRSRAQRAAGVHLAIRRRFAGTRLPRMSR